MNSNHNWNHGALQVGTDSEDMPFPSKLIDLCHLVLSGSL